jgi:hypothetical protein
VLPSGSVDPGTKGKQQTRGASLGDCQVGHLRGVVTGYVPPNLVWFLALSSSISPGTWVGRKPQSQHRGPTEPRFPQFPSPLPFQQKQSRSLARSPTNPKSLVSNFTAVDTLYCPFHFSACFLSLPSILFRLSVPYTAENLSHPAKSVSPLPEVLVAAKESDRPSSMCSQS